MRKTFALLAALLLAVTLGCNNDSDDCPTCHNGHCPVTVTDTPAPQAVTPIIPVQIQPTHQDAPPAAPALPPATTTGVKRAVIVGINVFLDPGAPPLSGCVLDAARLYAKSSGDTNGTVVAFHGAVAADKAKQWAVNNWGYDVKNITLLLNEQATVANVKAALNAAVAASKPGDSLIYWQSSHGTEDTIADDNGAAVHGIVCCYDFGWTREQELCDVDLKAIFSKLPDGVLFNWGADSCNSGGLDRNVGKHKHPVREKSVTQPPAVRQRVRAARIAGAKTRGMVSGELDVGFLPGCKPDQTSADSQEDDGTPGGALTIMFMKEVDAFAAQPLTALAKQMDADLAADGYDQVCVPDGARKSKPWGK